VGKEKVERSEKMGNTQVPFSKPGEQRRIKREIGGKKEIDMLRNIHGCTCCT